MPSWYVDQLTSDLEFELTEIQTCPRFSVGESMASISVSYVVPTNLGVHIARLPRGVTATPHQRIGKSKIWEIKIEISIYFVIN